MVCSESECGVHDAVCASLRRVACVDNEIVCASVAVVQGSSRGSAGPDPTLILFCYACSYVLGN